MKNTLIYLVANILNSTSPILLIPLLTRYLSPEDYGMYAMYSLVLNVVTAVIGLGTSGAVSVRYYQLEKKEMATYITTCMAMSVVAVILIISIIYTFYDYVENFIFIPPDWLFLLGATSIAQFIINIRFGLWQVQERPYHYGFLQISSTISNLTLSIVLVIFFSASWQSRALGHSLTILLFGAFALFSFFHRKEIFPQLSLHQGQDALAYGVPLLPHILFGLLISMADRAIVAKLLGEYSVGIYMLGLQLGYIMMFFADAFSKAFTPFIFKQLSTNTDESRSIITSLYVIIFFIFITLPLPVYYGIKIIFPMIIDEKYYESVNIAIYFIVGNGFKGLYYSISSLYFYKGKTGVLSINTFISSIITVFVTYALVSKIGVKGGAISYCFGQFVLLVICIIYAPIFKQLPWDSVFKGFSLDNMKKIFKN